MNLINQIRKIINDGSSRSIAVVGNIYDLFWDEDKEDYVPLIDYMSSKLQTEKQERRKGLTQIVYELNNPIEIKSGDSNELRKAWNHLKHGGSTSENQKSLDERLEYSTSKTPYALELMRQIFMSMRSYRRRENNLLAIIESADLLVAEKPVSQMNMNEKKRVSILHDWFSDPEFTNNGDTVLMIAESLHGIHHRISRLPQLVSVEIPLPDLHTRRHFLNFFSEKIGFKIENLEDVAEQTAGLAIQALRQLLLSRDVSSDNMAKKVEAYMESQLGEGVVEFKRPNHTLDDCKGHRKLKAFSKNVLLKGFDNGSIAGAAFGGPIGGGKTFVCEAIAREFKGPVIVLKNIRSKWFGETDAVFERLRRLLESFHRIVIFVDEADTQFGSVGSDGHATERRLTGKIQAMMSDVKLRGRVIWFLMTARIHLLSPDIRREGRMDLIVPVLDPIEEDYEEFVDWAIGDIKRFQHIENLEEFRGKVCDITRGYSAAQFSNLKNLTKDAETSSEFFDIAYDIIPSDVEETREYQALQAKINCTRASLLFDEGDLKRLRNDPLFVKKRKKTWRQRINQLEMEGVKGH